MLKDLGFNIFEDGYYVHWSEEVAYNEKNKTLYEFCEVDGIGESIVKVKNLEELQEIIENILML